MRKGYLFSDKMTNVSFDTEFDEYDFHSKNRNGCLTERDFDPPSDKRKFTSNVEDIDGGDNFADYCEYFFGLLDEEGYYDN